MKRIYIADTTLCSQDSTYTFKEKTEISRCLEKLGADAIELGGVTESKADLLLVRTLSSFVRNAVISIKAGTDRKSIENAASALSSAGKGRIRIELGVSVSSMEYIHGKKPAAMLEWIGEAVAYAKSLCSDVEFCALDATRAEEAFLFEAVTKARDAGADLITISDSASVMLPDDLASLAGKVKELTGVPTGVRCEEAGGMAAAASLMAVRAGADWIKTSSGGEVTSLETVSSIIKNTGLIYGYECGIRYTELTRTVRQIGWIRDNAGNSSAVLPVTPGVSEDIRLDVNDTPAAVRDAVAKLGYDLSDEDMARVFEEFERVSRDRNVGAKELEAIIASSAMQVPETYRVENYVINNGSSMRSSAQVTLSKNGEAFTGISLAGGPIDAAFKAIEDILGHHYELDDFQIQSVTEGKEAMGSALIRLRHMGKLYSGNGLSSDIIGASIRAYINALNKIAYEEDR